MKIGHMILALAALGAILAANPAFAGKLRILAPEQVWPQGVPLPGDWPGASAQPVTEGTSADGEMVWNVTQPSYQAFLPAPGKANGASVIIAPGGGFRVLSIRNSGTKVAEWLAARGIAAFVLRYRLVHMLPGETPESMRVRLNRTIPVGRLGEPAAADGIQALRLIRARSARYGIDPQRIGVIGFSAGGHVAGMMALAKEPAERPAFAGLIYGMPFSTPLPPVPPANLPFPAGTPSEPWLQPKPTPAPGALPRLFMAMAQDDVSVGSGFRAFYDTLYAAGYRPELHLYHKGSHGFGMKRQGTTSDHWIEEFHWWLEAEGLTQRRSPG
jgi:acetyl esterase/lipase